MRNLKETANQLGVTHKMSKVQVLASGFKGIDLEGLAPFEETLPLFESKINQQIRRIWEVKTAENPSMFAGPLASVKDFAMSGNVLSFQLQRSRFDIYEGLRQRFPSRLDVRRKPLDRGFCLPLSVGAVTITASDDKNPEGAIVFGIRSKSTAFGAGNSTTVPSGYLNPDTDKLEIGDTSSARRLMSIRLTALKELKEETNVQDYREFEYLGLVYDGAMAKGILVAVRLMLDFTSQELESVISNMGTEITEYRFVANNLHAVKAFIEEYPPTPHDVAKLVLHFAVS